jgi:hypothetical protein
VVIPPAYRAMIFSSTPARRRWPVLTSWGDPRTARVLLLALNPGWNPDTDRLERGVYAAENRKCLTFESDASLFSLDDRLVGTPG